jgi:3-dehydrotetronate 4-kinase
MAILLGAIGDDVTGSTDLALMLSKHGMSVVQFIGLPPLGLVVHEAQAAVVALKSRTAAVEQAVSESLAACDWLLAQGAHQIFFKYCSTFDSTEKGNIGPVAEALLERLDGGVTLYCPAFPENRRTVFNGHLFVGSDLLSDSSMRHHPLTPMTDSNLVRFLGKQFRNSETVALIDYATVDRGPAAIRERLQELAGRKCRHVVVDALTNRHLVAIGEACDDLKLVTGGSGVAMGLPLNFRRAGLLDVSAGPALLPKLEGGIAVLSGSCSAATRRQVARMATRCPAVCIDPYELAIGKKAIENFARWAEDRIGESPVLVYSTAEPEQVAAVQARLGREAAGYLIEQTIGGLALRLRQLGVRNFIVAGGETSGAVMAALQVRALRIGPEIAPGVPWTVTEDVPRLCLALKSGNFGDDDFFEKAVRMLP